MDEPYLENTPVFPERETWFYIQKLNFRENLPIPNPRDFTSPLSLVSSDNIGEQLRQL